MVVLRLLVKIPPPQLQTGHSFGGVNSTSHNNGDGTTETAFMLILRNPEKISMRTLTGQIQDKWMKLRPGFGPLQIKKLVDDKYPSVEIDADYTVADVFVDIGKAELDKLDQHAAVRVIQKPTVFAPLRMPSIDQEWNSFYAPSHARLQSAVHAIPPVPLFSSASQEDKRRSVAEASPRSFNESEPPNNLTNAADLPPQDRPLKSVEPPNPLAPPPEILRHEPAQVLDSQEPEIPPTPPRQPPSGSSELGSPIRPKSDPPLARRVTPTRRSGPRQASQISSPMVVIPKKKINHDTPVGRSIKPSRKIGFTSPKTPATPVDSIEKSDPPASIASQTIDTGVSKRKRSFEPLSPRKQIHPQTPKSYPLQPLNAFEIEKPDQSMQPAQMLGSPKAKSVPSNLSPACQTQEAHPSWMSPRARRVSSAGCTKISINGLGLGITGSPQTAKEHTVNDNDDVDVMDLDDPGYKELPVKNRISSPVSAKEAQPLGDRQQSVLNTFTPRVEQGRSALRKSSSVDQPRERRSVSFVDNGDSTLKFRSTTEITTPINRSSQLSKVKTANDQIPKEAQPNVPAVSSREKTPKRNTTKPANLNAQETPTILMDGTVYPGSADRISEIIRESSWIQKQLETPEDDWKRKIAQAEKARPRDREYVSLLKNAFTLWKQMKGLEQGQNKRQRGVVREKFGQAIRLVEGYESKKVPKIAEPTESTKPAIEDPTLPLTDKIRSSSSSKPSRTKMTAVRNVTKFNEQSKLTRTLSNQRQYQTRSQENLRSTDVYAADRPTLGHIKEVQSHELNRPKLATRETARRPRKAILDMPSDSNESSSEESDSASDSSTSDSDQESSQAESTDNSSTKKTKKDKVTGFKGNQGHESNGMEKGGAEAEEKQEETKRDNSKIENDSESDESESEDSSDGPPRSTPLRKSLFGRIIGGFF